MKINKIIGLACALGVLGSFGNAECINSGAEDNLGAPAANIERLSPEINELIAKADKGDAEAQYRLGCYYEYGKGVAKDLATALHWYKKAADQDHVSAELGIARLTKLLKKIDDLTAKANNGDAEAQYKLGEHYRYIHRFGDAFELYQKAADQGHIEAQFELGFCYEHGIGVAQDIEKALHWYKKAADQGHAAAKLDVARLTKLLKKINDLTAKAETGDAKAQYKLGKHYEDIGRFGDAAKWYQKAAEQGHRQAQYELGRCYEYGEGVAKDTEKALQWYQKAADQGHEFAKEKLELTTNK